MDADEVRALAAACQARDYDEEAIPMFLVLEGAAGAEPSAEDERLTDIAADYLAALADDPARPTIVEVSLALELLAARHFDPPEP